MRKRFLYIGVLIGLIISSCDDDVAIFPKTADERAAEAIASLKADLVAPANGWRIKYRPVSGSGSFYVLLDFNEDNTVTIKSDLTDDDEDFFNQTINYRIDNSLGIELVFQNYSFFSYLFEQNQATFGAEFEFNYVSKTDNILVFESKSDAPPRTRIVFEKATATDVNLLGGVASRNIQTMSGDLDLFSSSFKITFSARNLVLYNSMNVLERTINIHSASQKTNVNNIQSISFNSGYTFKGDSLVFDTPLTGTFLGIALKIKGIKLGALAESELLLCTEPIDIHSVQGVTSGNDAVVMEPSLLAGNGTNFRQESDFFVCPLTNIFKDGVRMDTQIEQNITGASSMQLYYNYDVGDGTTLNAIGFYIINADKSVTFALRKFTATFNNNNMVFSFAPDITLFGSQTTEANLDNINIYLNALTEGNTTYVFKYSDEIYEFSNPCTGWTFAFVVVAQ